MGICLELVMPDLSGGARAVDGAGFVRRDDVEVLSDGFAGFWVSNPASIVHLVAEEE